MIPAPARWRLDLLVVALLLVVVVGFWGDCLWGGKLPVAAIYQQHMLPWPAEAPAGGPTRQWDPLLWDSVAQFYPWRLLLHRAGQAGELPLWNPHQFGGYAFVGNGQSAIFYPPNWLYVFLHPRLGMGLSAALHYLLAALFTYGLARSLQLSRPAALMGALAFTWGGFMVTWIELPTLVNSLVWLPLAWWGIELVCRGPARRGAAMVTGALAMTLLAGHLQIAAYVWLFTLFYALARMGERWWWVRRALRIAPAEDLSALRRLPAGYYRRPAAMLIAAFALGGMLSLVQVLPALELGALSPRGGGGPTAAGFAFHRDRAVKPIELLALLQADFLGSPVTGDYRGISYSEHCGFVGATTLLVALAGLWYGRRSKHLWLLAGLAVFSLWGAMGGPPAALLYWGVPKLGQAGGFSRLLSVWTLVAALWGAMGLDAVLRALAAGGARSARRPVAVAAVLLLALELLPWAHRFNPRADAGMVYRETTLTRRLAELSAGDRYLAVTPRQAWRLDETPTAVLPPNAATVYGLLSVDGYDSLFPASYRAYAAVREGADPAPLANGNMLLLQNPTGWQGEVACVVGPSGTLTGVGRTDRSVDGCDLVVPPGAPPSRARFVEHASLVEVPLRLEHMPTLAVWDRGLNQVSIRIPPADGGTVVLRDSPYPGWRAYVDGRLAPVLGDQASRLVTVTPDARRLELVYYPGMVVAGMFLSLCGVAILTMWLTMARRGGEQAK